MKQAGTDVKAWLYMKNLVDIELCTLPYLPKYPENARYIPPWKREVKWREKVRVKDYPSINRKSLSILILASLSGGTGNKVTAIRISEHLRRDGYELRHIYFILYFNNC